MKRLHDPESEAGALGCVMMAEDASLPSHKATRAYVMVDQLRTDHFYDGRNVEVFIAMKWLRDRGRPVSLESVNIRMRNIKAHTDLPYLSSLVMSAPSPLQFPVYLEALQDKAWRRNTVRQCQKIIELSLDTRLEPEKITAAIRDLALT